MQEFLCKETTTFLYNHLQEKWKTNNDIINLFKQKDIYEQIKKNQVKVLQAHKDVKMDEKGIIFLNKIIIREMDNFFDFYIENKGEKKPKSILKKTKDITPPVEKEFFHLFFDNQNNYTANIKDSINEKICVKTCTVNNLENIHKQNNSFWISTNENDKQEFKVLVNNYTCDGLTDYINKILEKQEIKFIYNSEINKFCFSSNKSFHLFLNNNLAELIGFKNESYIGQNMYISDTQPHFDVFKNIYIQLTIGQQKLDFIKTNNNLSWYSILLQDNFKKILYEKNYKTILDIHDKNISIDLFDNYFNKITCNYSINVLFELVSCINTLIID